MLGSFHQQLQHEGSEGEWRDRFEGLKENGQLLRPRFRPGWRPSSLQAGVNRFLSEDFYAHRGPCKKSNGWELSLSKGFHPDRHGIPISAKEAIQGRYRLHSAPTVHHFIDFEYSLNSRRLGLGTRSGWSRQRTCNVRRSDRRTIHSHWVFFRSECLQGIDLEKISKALAIFEPMYPIHDRPAFRRRLHPYGEDRRTRCYRDFNARYRDMGHISWYFFKLLV